MPKIPLDVTVVKKISGAVRGPVQGTYSKEGNQHGMPFRLQALECPEGQAHFLVCRLGGYRLKNAAILTACCLAQRGSRRPAGAWPPARGGGGGHPPVNMGSSASCAASPVQRIEVQVQGNQPVAASKVSGTFFRCHFRHVSHARPFRESAGSVAPRCCPRAPAGSSQPPGWRHPGLSPR